MVDNIPGVEILNITTQHDGSSLGLLALAIIFGILAVAVAIYLYYAAINNILDKCGHSLVTIISCFVLALIFSGLAILMLKQIPPLWSAKENIAYVTIDDTVPWSVVNNQYELVRQEGKIYILKIKELPQENCNE